MPCQKVAVVGGGFSGLGAIKALKEENIEAVCFEKSSEIGGTWVYRNNDSGYKSSTVMSTTTLNQSKEMGAVSNYPFPPDSPNHMRHQEVYKYIMQIFEDFDLTKYVTRNREVTYVKRAADYDDTGRWDVTVRNTQTQETITETFDGVIICTGMLGSPIMPSFPGMDKFKGRIMHTQELRTFESFMGENVVVVGTGCSALDAAAEISSVAKQVYWSVRTPAWIIPRIASHGLPVDYLILRRYITFFQRILPVSWASKMLEYLFISPRFNHKLYGIDPKYPLLCKDPTINDVIASKLMNGSVSLRKNIERIGEDCVVFEGETEYIKADTIIMGTGYGYVVPNLEKGILVHEEKGKIFLYKGVFPPYLKHPTIAFMGYLLPIGPGFPIGEMQSRWIAHVFSGKGSLPSKKQMIEEIENRYQQNLARFDPSEKMSTRVDFVPYLDDLATEIGAMPNFWKMAFTDPRLFMACVFGPCVSFQYRLVGPHKWEGARDAILKVSTRVKAPLRPSESDASDCDTKENYIMFRVLLMIECALWMIIPNMPADLATNISAVLLAAHLIFIRNLGGKFLLYCFLPLCVFSWFLFPNFIPYLCIFQAISAIVFN